MKLQEKLGDIVIVMEILRLITLEQFQTVINGFFVDTELLKQFSASWWAGSSYKIQVEVSKRRLKGFVTDISSGETVNKASLLSLMHPRKNEM